MALIRTMAHFTYVDPRNGNPMRSDLNVDGAKFQADNHVTMGWSSFEYGTDVPSTSLCEPARN